ncbi:MAG: energy-coupling factor transporter transmembrane protein EcfT [Clostridia bacterium]|nr:energy-coupling factor transporter transmembrane protein EcfT [Clostridia bacterium]
MKEFKTYHPIVNFIYFLLVIGLSMFLMHPVSLGITLFSAIFYIAVLKGRKAAYTSVISAIPVMLLGAVINPLFSHEGITVITYFKSGNPLTAESIYYGLAAATMLTAVIIHFASYNEVMTSDKFIYLFGRIIPSLSLVISMTLRFVPTFIARLREIRAVQRTLGVTISEGSLLKRLRSAIRILSILVTWSLENAVETADSMKSRGYGLSGRTAYSIFRFERRDLIAMLWMMSLVLVIFTGIYSGALAYTYFPVFTVGKISIGIHAAYLLLCITPVIIEMREAIRWKAIK